MFHMLIKQFKINLFIYVKKSFCQIKKMGEKIKALAISHSVLQPN